MHDDHEHHHHGHHDHHHGPGHNQPPRRAVQWQVPHRAGGAAEPAQEQPEPDFDLVEAAFVEDVAIASDPTSFLRLAGVPLQGQDAAGRRLCLLRVELDARRWWRFKDGGGSGSRGIAARSGSLEPVAAVGADGDAVVPGAAAVRSGSLGRAGALARRR